MIIIWEMVNRIIMKERNKNNYIEYYIIEVKLNAYKYKILIILNDSNPNVVNVLIIFFDVNN